MTTLHTFNPVTVDGQFQGWTPLYGVARAPDGTLYGGTVAGSKIGGMPPGLLYKLDPAGHYSVLRNVPQSNTPSALALSAGGALYGTTQSNYAPGEVFSLRPAGAFRDINPFDATNLSGPTRTKLVVDRDGTAFGMTVYGGNTISPNTVGGAVFKITPSGVESVLYAFKGGSNGSQPHDAPVLDSAGNLYGVTYYGGPASLGLVYLVTASGQETVLHAFSGHGDGHYPTGTLSIDAAGSLCGTAVGDLEAIPSDSGTVFKITH